MPGEWLTAYIDTTTLAQIGDLSKISSFVGDAVDSSGNRIPFPPLHVHHIHVCRLQTMPRLVQQHWLEVHGDYSPDYRTTTPSGYCRVHGKGASLLVLAQYKDVRPMGLLNTPLGWSMRLTFGIPTRPCKPIGKLLFWYPMTDDAMTDMLGRFDVGNADLLRWWSVQVDVSGTLAPPAWLHAHRARFAGLIVTRGTSTPFDFGTLTVNHRMAVDASSLRNYMLMTIPPADVLCYDNHSVPTYERVHYAGSWQNYDRRGQIVCIPMVFNTGDTFTIFSFTRSVWDQSKTTFRMHTILFSHYHPTPATMATNWSRAVESSVYIQPTHYGLWNLSSKVLSVSNSITAASLSIQSEHW
jgi:hypothetical protein